MSLSIPLILLVFGCFSGIDGDETRQLPFGLNFPIIDWGFFPGPSFTPVPLNQCNGMKQSPINLQKKLIQEPSSRTITMKYFAEISRQMSLRNNGHTADFHFTYAQQKEPMILDENGRMYVLDQLHFHWGENNTVGSEHVLEGRRLPLEMHILFFERRYRTLQEAIKIESNDNTVIVLTFFFEITAETGPLMPITKISNLLANVETTGSTYELKKNEFFSIDEFFTQKKFNLLSYNGSLTTPPCTETVRWLFPSTLLKVNVQIMNRFRMLKDPQNQNIVHNYRDLQAINGRMIRSILANNIVYDPMSRV